MTLTPVPAFNDNYIWCLSRGDRAWVVDPGDATPVMEHLKREGLALEGVLITHHHPDHTGGISTLSAEHPDLVVVGPDNPRINGLTRRINEGESVELLGCHFDVLATPGHTLDHLCYFSDTEQQRPILFCGDTLFAGGCGRLFEGTATQMLNSLQKLAALPPRTQVCAAHEYTLSNLAFALAVEPDNPELQQRLAHCQQLREQNTPTLPSSLQEELNSNPFMRTREPSVVEAAQRQGAETTEDESAIFAAIRSWKDRF
ncbi:hydroxyacylglutathione hydrolase [Aestuariirhabdus litorea]|uniref:Hydroxyacylglutathione hydrolase n=1 Tax=Aestuariirhabdus litorea TaxID=2528527 RepID=A0A3P3VRR3_9GAMM|nr:hydroxyacylglutathione hydrolase [Aestuariirhabdus litorea]RWW98690.1 hydroxyacylglutathione hydrolase [Endozoicomonadaceae bacterium GTF-13]